MKPALIRPQPFTQQIADAVILAELSSDDMLAKAARLIDLTLSNRGKARVNAPAAQPLVDYLETAITAQFTSRRAMLAFHADAAAIGRRLEKADGEDLPYGPTEPCKFVKGEADTPAVSHVA